MLDPVLAEDRVGLIQALQIEVYTQVKAEAVDDLLHIEVEEHPPRFKSSRQY